MNTWRPGRLLIASLALLWVALLALLVWHGFSAAPDVRQGYVLAAAVTEISDTATAPICSDLDPCTVTLSPAGWQAIAAVSGAVVLLLSATFWMQLR